MLAKQIRGHSPILRQTIIGRGYPVFFRHNFKSTYNICTFVSSLIYDGVRYKLRMLLLLTFFTNPEWINNHTPSTVWDEITYPFLNFKCWSVDIWEWIRNFIPTLLGVLGIVIIIFSKMSHWRDDRSQLAWTNKYQSEHSIHLYISYLAVFRISFDLYVVLLFILCTLLSGNYIP